VIPREGVERLTGSDWPIHLPLVIPVIPREGVESNVMREDEVDLCVDRDPERGS